MTTDDLVKWERKARTGIITLNRVEARNALTSPMLQRLDDLLCACEVDQETRVVIIKGEGNFCAGADIREMAGLTPAGAEEFSRLGHTVFRRIEALSKVVIATVAGNALGGGCELAMACDIRLAGESARFGQPEVNLGLIPGFGGTQRLAALVGPGRARELLLSGRIVEAREAQAMGLVSNVVADRDLQEQAEELAALLARKSPVALAAIKELLLETTGLEQGLKQEVAAFAECFDSQDRKEGIAAFLEKRHPAF
ncbi:MAG: enoyl-CoA hydratase-related protein [Geobacteraceae bacterium]